MNDTIFEIAVVGKLAPGSKLRDCRRVTHSRLGADFDRNCDKEQWQEYGRALKGLNDLGDLYRADWLKFGRKKFGPEVVKECADQLQFDYSSLDRSTAIALFPREKRRESLKVEHYAAFGNSLHNEEIKEEDIDRWILLIEEENLSPAELIRSLAAGRVVRIQSQLPQGGIATIQAVNSTFSRWLKTVETNSPIEKMDASTKAEIFEELKPIGEFFERLKAELATQ